MSTPSLQVRNGFREAPAPPKVTARAKPGPQGRTVQPATIVASGLKASVKMWTYFTREMGN